MLYGIWRWLGVNCQESENNVKHVTRTAEGGERKGEDRRFESWHCLLLTEVVTVSVLLKKIITVNPAVGIVSFVVAGVFLCCCCHWWTHTQRRVNKHILPALKHTQANRHIHNTHIQTTTRAR